MNYHRKGRMYFRLVKENELDKVLYLYKEAQREKFCVWDDEYPTMTEILNDFKTNNLYVYLINDIIVGALSVLEESELNKFNEWEQKENIKELARVVVDKNYHGNGIAVKMVANIIEILNNKNVNAVHLACQCDNIPAIKTYEKVGFNFLAKKYVYGHDYFICEYVIK